MKKIDLNQSVGLLANIGVLLGIALLIYELGQNREMMRAQTRAAISEDLTTILLAYAANDESAAIISGGDRGEELSDAEARRYGYLRLAGNRYFENVYYQYRQGLFDEEEYLAQKEGWASLFAERGIAENFCNTRLRYSPEFVAEIESLLTAHTCE